VTGRERTDNAAGHIQFFSVRDVHRLVHWSGGRVLRTRTYFPVATFRNMASGAAAWRRAYYLGWVIANRVLGPRVLLLLYYGHFAVLVDHGGPDDRGAGTHPLFWHPDAP
jgi:hypothetical protein